jgi:hypothetical protein
MMSAVPPVDADAKMNGVLKGPAAGFGLAAVIAILFNTALAWAENVDEPLNAYMASLSGDPWRTHGFAAVAVFIVLGYFFTSRGFRIDGSRLAALLVAASIVAGGGLALWLVLI